MANLQKHTHSDYCCRNKSCCFGFPKPPATKTLISRPPVDDNDEIMENAKSVLQTVQDTPATADLHNEIATVNYVCSYMTKSEKGMPETLKSVTKEC